MRFVTIIKTMAAFAGLALSAAAPADASECFRCARPHGWDQTRVVKHWVYYPRYAHVYSNYYDTDPYAYRYAPRGYYPYYNSGYWVPAQVYRRPTYPYRLPPYYQAWGYPKAGYRHYKWHYKHHGGHRHHHW